MKVGIIFGSKSDVDVMKGAADCLKKFGIEYTAHVLSAHRVPELLEETLEKFEKEDYGVIISIIESGCTDITLPDHILCPQ